MIANEPGIVSGRHRSALRESVAKFLVRWRPARRAIVWAALFRELKGRTFAQQISLAISAAVDWWAYVLHWSEDMPPRALWSAEVRSPRLGVTFHIRGGSDDLYSVAPFREGDVHDAILGALRPGDVFVDVGANIGYYTVLAARRVQPAGSVVAIEAVPESARQLERNLRANGIEGVRLVQAVASARSGQVTELRIPRGRFGLASTRRASSGQGSLRVSAPTVALDDICRDLSVIRVMKVDVEGAELDVLRGAEETLRRTERVVIECDFDALAIKEFLMNRGFRIRKLRFTSYILAERAAGALQLREEDIRGE